LQKALRIATRSGSSLELYICDAVQDLPDSWAGGSKADEYRELTRGRLLRELNLLAEPIKAQGLHVSTVCEWHAPLEQGIEHHVVRSRPDLVIKETHRHMPMAPAMLGLTDWTLIRQVPVPLLLVRAKEWASTPQIAAAVDPCHSAECPAAPDESVANYGRILAYALTGSFSAGAPLEDLQSLQRGGVPDVLVIGVSARSGFTPIGPSGTAVRILERWDCDLLVVKPSGFVTPLLVAEDSGMRSGAGA
jgi:nucleotide-binding universal stress UspA family protein